MKNYIVLLFSLLLFSCTKSVDNTTKIGPVDVSVIADTSVKFFVQNTDIPILLDSMTLNLFGFIDNNNNYYVENIKINPGTTLEQFSKNVFRYNVPQQTVNNSNGSLVVQYNWSTRFLTHNFTTNSYNTIQNINLLSFKDKIIVTNGIFIGLDTYEYIGQPVLYLNHPSKYDKFLISKRSFGVDSDPNKIRLFAIKKNSTISTPPTVKNFDGRMISFSESNNYYYLYFYPITSASDNNTTLLKDLIFYKNPDLYTSILGSNNFTQSGYERVYIVEYIKDGNGRIVTNLNNLIRTNSLY